MGTKPRVVASHKMWSWPEFRAFAERLGIPIELPTRSLSIHIDIADCREVVVDQQFLGQDSVAEKP